MNEVARCAQLALGIAALAEPGPVALADLGTGAGLGLHLDRYRYRVGGQVSGPASGSVDGPASGPAEATLTLDCAVRGPLRPPAAGPAPHRRAGLGLDVHPVDLADPAARAWLEACAPPEATALSRLSAAIEVARRHPVPLVAGDVIDALPGVLDRFPPGRPVLVTDAYLAVFLSDGQREQTGRDLRPCRPAPPGHLDVAGPAGPARARWPGTACRACRCRPGWSVTTPSTACSRC